MENAILGQMMCGHIVAIDLDDTKAHRAAFKRRGYTVVIKPKDEALGLFRKEAIEHTEKCKGRKVAK